MTIYWRATDIECVLAYFGDSQYTIKIDRLRTGEIRYLCWHKSNSILGKPDLVLNDGQVTENNNGETVEYTFICNDKVFTVEHIPPHSEGGTHYYFIEVTDKDNKKSTWKMEQMPIPRYFRYLI
ncbi:hypothetical protein PY092_18845 [Muricauda sp. 334s03]|uniref:Uncharacterized protein n=1 Tax=Flagellimonas yonaguniensis TaxID=3031325 RepID=A0ABT5Y5G1_9FLAO|nr:hypothetical protein [[Muricauda] yonaguniensis]MDF0718227.1 hypothetical protein [[Muricauda] yonaguniensis]